MLLWKIIPDKYARRNHTVRCEWVYMLKISQVEKLSTNQGLWKKVLCKPKMCLWGNNNGCKIELNAFFLFFFFFFSSIFFFFGLVPHWQRSGLPTAGVGDRPPRHPLIVVCGMDLSPWFSPLIGEGIVLKLKKALYSLKQCPCVVWEIHQCPTKLWIYS